MNACKHFNCAYRGVLTDTCDYYLITGQRRQCPAGSCKRYVRRAESGGAPLNPESAAQEMLMLDLYSAGLGDGQIARELGLSVKYVRAWRDREELPAQSKLLYAAR